MMSFFLWRPGILPSEDTPRRRYVPFGYICFDVPRTTISFDTKTNHGGIAAIFSDRLKCKLVSPPFRLKTFESVWFTVNISTATVMVLLIQSAVTQ